MPDTRSGIETGGESTLDVNSDAGFNASLARKLAGGEQPSEEVQSILDGLEDRDTSVAAGLTTEESAPRRDDQGRFTPAAPVVVEEEGAAPAGDEREGEEEGAALADFLARHAGDPNAALAAALKEKEEAQSLIGRQSAEVSAARAAEKEAAELRERIARLEGRADAQPAAATPIVDASTVEWIEGNVARNDGSGGAETMRWVAENRPDLIEATLDVWEQYEPVKAARFAVRYDQIRESGAQQQEPQPDPLLDEMRRERQLGGVLKSVRESMTEGDWNLVKPHVGAVLEDDATPALVRRAVYDQDPDTQRQGVETVIALAKGRVIAQATAKVTAEAQAERKAENTEAKKKATLGTGSLRPADERQPQAGEDMTREERIALFKKGIMQAETTSVADGITYAS